MSQITPTQSTNTVQPPVSQTSTNPLTERVSNAAQVANLNSSTATHTTKRHRIDPSSISSQTATSLSTQTPVIRIAGIPVKIEAIPSAEPVYSISPDSMTTTTTTVSTTPVNSSVNINSNDNTQPSASSLTSIFDQPYEPITDSRGEQRKFLTRIKRYIEQCKLCKWITVAISFLEKITGKNKYGNIQFELIRELITLYIETSQFEKVIAACKSALNTHTNIHLDSKAHLLLDCARAQFYSKKFKEAITTCELALNMNNLPVPDLFLIVKRNSQAALTSSSTTTTIPSNSLVQGSHNARSLISATAANAMSSQSKFRSSNDNRTALMTSAAINSHSLVAQSPNLTILGSIALDIEQKQYDKAISTCNTQLNSNLSDTTKSRIYFALIEALYLSEKFEDAIATCNKALELEGIFYDNFLKFKEKVEKALQQTKTQGVTAVSSLVQSQSISSTTSTTPSNSNDNAISAIPNISLIFAQIQETLKNKDYGKAINIIDKALKDPQNLSNDTKARLRLQLSLTYQELAKAACTEGLSYIEIDPKTKDQLQNQLKALTSGTTTQPEQEQMEFSIL